MNQSMRPEVLATNSASRPVLRGPSMLGEKPVFSKTILSPPPPTSPDPAYISSSAASQWVSAELDDDDLSISDAALALLNSFLDQMLFSFLSSAHSTRLPQLRQAIPEVLKPRLGKEAMASADEELREYLGDGEDEELSDFYDGQEPAKDFNLELAWKLTRLRCMVYTRLGDLEEEDAVEILRREKLDERSGQYRRFSSSSSNITPAGAIFLTSIIEYLGEQALYHAGILAQTRVANVHPHAQEGAAGMSASPSPMSQTTIIEEIDVRRLGREGPLARIWRNWRRPARSPPDSLSRPIPSSDDGDIASPGESLTQRTGITVGSIPLPTIAQTIHSGDPAQIPLPMSENDVDEIEVPGLVPEVEESGISGSTERQVVENVKRSNSMTFLPHNAEQPLTSTSIYMPSNLPQRPPFGRYRSQSLPTPTRNPQAAAPDSHRQNVDSTASSDPGKLDKEAGSTMTCEIDGSGVDAATQIERSRKRNGLVVDQIPAVADTTTSRPMVENVRSERKEAEPIDTTSETVADTMPQGSLVADQVPPSTATEASVHHVADLKSIPRAEEHQTSKFESTETPNEETDPEDLALSSADEDREVTQRRSKHDSVPPVKVGSSSYIYSTQPGDSNIPTPAYSDFPEAPTHPRVVTVTQAGQVTQPEADTKGGIASTTSSEPQFSANEVNKAAQELPNQLECKPEADVPVPVAKPSLTGSTLRGSVDSELLQHSSHSTSSSKPLGYARDGQGKPVPSTTNEGVDVRQAEPAGPQRGVNGSWSTPSISTGMSKDVRPGTAVPQRLSDKPPLRLRSSSENGKEAVGRTSFESEAKKRSLELLIQGDETLHYTLTPTTARETEVPDPVRRTVGRSHDSGDYGKNAASFNQQPVRHKAQQSISSIISTNGLRSYPVKEQFASQAPAAVPASPTSSPLVQTSRPGTASSKIRHGEPRDAKVESSTNRDLADYLRSTGPEGAYQLPRAVVHRPTTSAIQAPPTAGTAAAQYSQNAEQPRAAKKASSQAPLQSSDGAIHSRGSSTVAPSKSSSTSRYVPRDAQVSKNATTTALADFIREGPPRAAGDHRIPRAVAPFRRTMDSDDLNGLVSSTDKDQPGRTSAASTQDGSTVSQSMQSSTNSHTALLDRTQNMAPGPSGKGTRAGSSKVSASLQSTGKDAIVKRKQRRVRDPYAIDDSDDDMEEVATLKPNREEESLIDFLRNTAPPPSMTAQPVVAPNSSAASRLQKKNSSSAMRDRIRNTNIPGMSRNGSVTATDPPAYSRGKAPPRAESPHLSQTGSKLDSYKPTQPTHAAHVDRIRSSRINGALGSSAEHLPNTDHARADRAANGSKDESGFLAFFSRRKSTKK